MTPAPTTPEDDELRQHLYIKDGKMYFYQQGLTHLGEPYDSTSEVITSELQVAIEAYAARQAETAATAARVDEVNNMPPMFGPYKGERLAALSSNSQEGSK